MNPNDFRRSDLPADYGSPERVASIRKLVREMDRDERAGRLGPMRAYLRDKFRVELAYASISGPA